MPAWMWLRRRENAPDLVQKALAGKPDVAICDVQMPPGERRTVWSPPSTCATGSPQWGSSCCLNTFEPSYALELIGDRPQGVGYLLKSRVGNVGAFVDAVERVAAGGSALDPEVVARMLGRQRRDDPLGRLTTRERAVLESMAEGKSNIGIAGALCVSEAAVEKHVTAIFRKLELGSEGTEHRRVRAVLTYVSGRARPTVL